MNFLPNAKTLLQIGPLHIQWYAIFILSGAFLAYYFSVHNNFKVHHSKNLLSDYFFYVLWTGVIGARLWYCLFYDLNYYLASPFRFFKIYEGGLAIHGGVIAGAIFTYFFCRKKKLSFLRFADSVLPSVLLAQAIGRIGNFVNQEAFGQRVDPSYFNGVLSFLKEGMHIDGYYYEPMFFYESSLNLIGFFLIAFVLKRKQNKRGDLAWAYFMWYGVVRFFIETRRSDALMLGSLKIAQVISILSLLIGIAGYLGLWDCFFKEKEVSILFDVDGTLLDTSKVIIDSYKALFKKRNCLDLFTNEEQIAVLGPTLDEKLSSYFPDEDLDSLKEEYRQIQLSLIEKEVTMMPNLKEMLNELKQHKGYHLGIVSSRMHDSILNLLKLFNLEEYFEVIIGLDDCQRPKPEIDGLLNALKNDTFSKDNVVYIGDTPNDIKMGKTYGAYTIVYLYKNLKKDKCLAANPDNSLDNWADLKAILTKVNFIKLI